MKGGKWERNILTLPELWEKGREKLRWSAYQHGHLILKTRVFLPWITWRDNAQCYNSIKYWRNWWHLLLWIINAPLSGLELESPDPKAPGLPMSQKTNNCSLFSYFFFYRVIKLNQWIGILQCSILLKQNRRFILNKKNRLENLKWSVGNIHSLWE